MYACGGGSSAAFISVFYDITLGVCVFAFLSTVVRTTMEAAFVTAKKLGFFPLFLGKLFQVNIMSEVLWLHVYSMFKDKTKEQKSVMFNLCNNLLVSSQETLVLFQLSSCCIPNVKRHLCHATSPLIWTTEVLDTFARKQI